MSTNSIGILGGTFNPVHNGHLAIARQASAQLKLEAVYLIPSSNPPHKDCGQIVPYSERMKMVELAAAESKDLFVSDLDNTGSEKSFTKNLIIRFREKYPRSKIYFIIGADNIPQLKTWYDYRWLLQNVVIAAVNRKGDAISEEIDYLDKIVFIDIPPVDISSEDIRRRISESKDISGLVPQAVASYIEAQGLYRSRAGMLLLHKSQAQDELVT